VDGVIRIYDVARGPRSRLILEGGVNLAASWSPDGKRILHCTSPLLRKKSGDDRLASVFFDEDRRELAWQRPDIRAEAGGWPLGARSGLPARVSQKRTGIEPEITAGSVTFQ
jgi:hypothetical protein